MGSRYLGQVFDLIIFYVFDLADAYGTITHNPNTANTLTWEIRINKNSSCFQIKKINMNLCDITESSKWIKSVIL